MSAQEMFEELGWEFDYNSYIDDELGLVVYKHKIFNERIFFNAYDGEYVKLDDMVQLDVQLIKAITQQMRELGWI